MSKSLDKVRGVPQLPLFPLPVVLFPATPLPLHIFEPRYRQMLKDVRITNNLFGLPYFDTSADEAISRPPIGSLGCVAEVRDVEETEDGRSNILSVGVCRFRLEDYLDSDEPYLVAAVSYFEDDAEDAEFLEPRARAVRDLFLRVAHALRELAGDRVRLPELPEVTPEHLSYFVAAAIEIDVSVKLEMLETRSTSERLKRLHEILSQAAQVIEDRAKIGKAAQSNGHSKKQINFE